MRFQVPQFVDVEDKIFGPLTLKQFIYLAGGAGLAFTLFALIPVRIIGIAFATPVVILGLALAFYKDKANRPFIVMLESMFNYYIRSRLYIWRKVPKKITPTEKKEISQNPQAFVPRLSDSKLKDLAWSLDIHDSQSYGGKK